MVAPGSDAADDEQRHHHRGDHVAPVLLPQPQQIVATQLLIDFAEYVAHERPSPNSPVAVIGWLTHLPCRGEPNSDAGPRRRSRSARLLDAPPEMVKIAICVTRGA